MARIKRIATELQVKDKLLDYSGDAGTSGQLLSSTGTGTNWITFSGVTASNGANTRVAFFTGSTTIEGSTGLYWNNSDNRLGIGTSSPAYTLDVAGTIRVGSGGSIQPLLSRDSATGGLIVSSVNNSGDFIFKGSGGNEKFRITDSGNVGIGTDSPGVPLDVFGANGIRTTVNSGALTAGYFAQLHSDYGANALRLKSRAGDVFRATDYGQAVAILTGTTSNGTSERMRITNTGLVGIGTTSPGAILDVRTSANSVQVGRFWNSASGSSAHSAVRIASSANNANSARLEFSDANYYTGTISADRVQGMVFRTEEDGTNPTGIAERMRITKTGNVGIGTTSPAQKLHVDGNIRVGDSADVIYSNKFQALSNADTEVRSNNGYDLLLNSSAGDNVGIGTSSPGKKLTVNGQTQFYEYSGAHLTHDATSNFNFDTLVNHASATDGGGLQSYIKLTASATNSSLGQFNAIRTRAYAENTTNNVGGLINFYAEYRNFTSTSSVTLGNHYGLKVNTLGVGGSATVTNNYGVYLNPGTAATNNYGVFQAGGSVKNKFEGPVGINTNPAAGVELHVNGEIRVDSTSGVATRKIRSGYFSSTTDIIVASGSAASVRLQNGSTDGLVIDSSQNATFSGDVAVTGNLTVGGTTTIINTATIEVEDNILQLNTTQGSPDTATATTSGISVYRGDGVTQASFIFDDADDTWDLTNNLAVADKIGINKSSPTGRLHINQTVDNQGIIIESGSVQPEIEFRDTATGDTFSIGHNRAASQLTIEVDGTDKYVFTDGGRLGIGTISPGAALSAVTAETTVGIFKSTTDQTIIKIEDNDTIGYIGVKDNDIAIGGNSTMTADANFKIDTTTGTAAFGLSPSATDKFRLRQTFNTSNDTSNNGLFIDYNVSGTDALTADRNAIALRVDMDSTATGGDQTKELTMYAGYFDVTDDGDANHLYGMYAQAIAKKTATNDTQSTVHAYKGLARAGHTAGQVNQIVGGEFIAQTDNNGGTINELNAVKGLIQNTGDSGIDVGTARAGLFKVDISPSSNDPVYTNIYGIDTEIEMDETTTINNAFVNFSRVDANQGTITSAYLYRGTYNVHSNATVTHKHGIYLDGSERNYIQGSMNLGGTGLYNTGVPLAVKAIAANTAEVLTKIWDGTSWAFSIDRSSTNTDANTELYRLGLNYNNGGAANGYIGFFRGTGGGNGYLTFGSSNTERMRIDTSGNVGIGTTSPSQKLEVNGNILVNKGTTNRTAYLSDDGLYISRTTVADSYPSKIVANSNNSNNLDIYARSQISLILNSTTRLVANDSGNVGIGTTSPSSRLHIDSTSDAMHFTRSGQETYRIIHGTSGLYFTRPDSSALAFGVTQNSDFHTFDTSGNVLFAADASEGRIGIGTSSPARNLHIHQGDSTLSYLQITNTTTGAGGGDGVSFGITSDEVAVWTNRENTDTTISTNNTERIRIKNDGNVGIGTSSPSEKLDVVGNATFSGTVTVQGDELTLGDGAYQTVLFDTSPSSIIGNGTMEIQPTTAPGSGTANFTTYFKNKTGGGTTKHHIKVDGTATFGGNVEVGTNTLNFADNGKARFGNSTDLQIYHDATNSKIENDTGTLNIINNAVDKSVTFQATSDSGGSNATELYLSLIPTFGQVGGGGSVFVYKDFLMAQDTTKIRLGASQDLEIYHDGSHSYIKDSGTGVLKLLGSGVTIQNATGSENMLVATQNAGVDLYYNGSKKFEITSGGVVINGGAYVNDYLIHSGDSDTKIGFLQNDGIAAYIGGNEVFSATSSGTAISHNGAAKIITQATSVDIYDADLGVPSNKVVKDRKIPFVIRSSFDDMASSTSIFVIPWDANVETTVSGADEEHIFVAPYAGELTKVQFKHVKGTLSSGFTTELKFYKNGSSVAASGELTASNDAITWTPTSSNTFSANDELMIAYQKSATSKYWQHVSASVVFSFTNYDI